MSCLLILVSIALAITFSNHSSQAANLPLTITDIVLCNNNNILRSGSSGKLECRFRRSKLILGQETKEKGEIAGDIVGIQGEIDGEGRGAAQRKKREMGKKKREMGKKKRLVVIKPRVRRILSVGIPSEF
ncbi:hypothetical protein F2Q69_00016319 [Brassica cretica]|uniref:Uncharacterized protein n=1 Tax=Brassica cretica TaxID=69181 RepID=A0A8S9QP64_BRACR|nr:hypothetical protein F2Q69_00016319 [Brassica cretica]